MDNNITKLYEMLRYKRPEGSTTQKLFCERFLEPLMGDPDQFGNYVHIIYEGDGKQPTTCFTAHHDTVHKTEGTQEVLVRGNMATAPESNCLGADCTTGVFLILEMIEAGKPGIYVVHAAEEVGCVGSEALVESDPWWLATTLAVISFDRYGTSSIITHQMGVRTASDAFAKSLEAQLKLNLKPDPTGVYTDSNSYEAVVPECTNISVGYYGQHTSNEKQDMVFVQELLKALLAADFNALAIERDPEDRANEASRWWWEDDEYYTKFEYNTKLLSYIFENYAEEVAEFFDQNGVDAEQLASELGIQDYYISNHILDRRNWA